MIVKPRYNDDEYNDIGPFLPDAGQQEHRGTHVLTPESLPEQVLHHAPEQRHRVMKDLSTQSAHLCLSSTLVL